MRTTSELDKILLEFEKGVKERFLARTYLGDMMTERDKKKHRKLCLEYVEAKEKELK